MKTYIIDEITFPDYLGKCELTVTDKFKDNPILEIKSVSNPSFYCGISLLSGNIFEGNELSKDDRDFLDNYMRSTDNHNGDFSMWFSYIDEYIQDRFTDKEYVSLLHYMKLTKAQLLIPDFSKDKPYSITYNDWIDGTKHFSKEIN